MRSARANHLKLGEFLRRSDHPFHALVCEGCPKEVARDWSLEMDFLTLLKGGGPVAVLLLLVSVYAAFVFFYRYQVFAKATSNPAKLYAQIKADLLAANVRLAVADVAREDSPAAKVLTAGLERVQYGSEAVQAGVQQAMLLEEERFGRGLGTLATIAQVAPMLGLLGTVFGMIRAFTVFSQVSQPSPNQLAGGISEALVSTAAGLIVAVLSHVGHSFLTRRYDSLLNALDHSKEFLTTTLIEAGLYTSESFSTAKMDSLEPPKTLQPSLSRG
jgi:biopolymer transport protein ExbB